jgi:hypothetical protein
LRRVFAGIAFTCLLTFTAVALAYPPVTITDLTQNAVTLRGLDCGTQYRIQLEERNASNTAWESPTTQTVTTAACPAAAPVAEFGVSPDPAVRNQATTFRSTGTCAAAPCSYRWVHGTAASTDAIGTGTTASFTYTGAPGTRTVTLKVTDSQNREAVRTRSFQLVESSSLPPAAQCSDGRDNDGDGATDYPADAGCSSATDNDESNVVGAPSSGFPDESNTGVPSGTTLAPISGITVREAGRVIEAVDAPWISVEAPNVTIRRSRIGPSSMPIVNRSTGLVVEDTTIVGRDGTGIMFSNYTARRVEVSGSENGFQAGENVTIEDSWVHDLDTSGGAHTDGIQFSPGAGNIVIRHNNLDPVPGTSGATSPIIMHTGGDPQNHDVRIEDNRLDGTGSSVALYCPRRPAQRIYINNNRMLKGVFGGYVDSCSVPSTATEFNGNVDDLTGALIRR